MASRRPPSRRLWLFDLIAQRRWVPVTGYVFCIALLTAGYYYNLTFVQLGLIDLGTSRLGMSGRGVSLVMALLALVALAVAVATGVVMDRRGWSGDLRTRLRVLTVVTAVQLTLTLLAPLLGTPGIATSPAGHAGGHDAHGPHPAGPGTTITPERSPLPVWPAARATCALLVVAVSGVRSTIGLVQLDGKAYAQHGSAVAEDHQHALKAISQVGPLHRRAVHLRT